MNAQTMIAVILIVAGVAAIAYGGFSYTRETHQADLGPLQMTIKDRQYVGVPVWAGVGSIVVGGALLLMRRRGSR